MKYAAQALVAAAALVSVIGCGAHRPGFPRQSYDEDAQIMELEKAFSGVGIISDYYDDTKTPADKKQQKRDEIISGRLALINLNYNKFVSSFSFDKQSIDTVTDIGVIGVDLAATAVGAATTKTILVAISTGLTGSKLSIDKNFFYEKTVQALVGAMNAQRKVALVPIIQGMTKPASEYTLAQALADLDAYYRAGTFVGALQGIQADAGAKEAQADVKIEQIRTTDYLDDKWGRALQSFWMPGAPQDPTPNAKNQAALQKWMDDNDLKNVPIQTFITGGKIFAKKRQEAVKAFDIPVKP